MTVTPLFPDKRIRVVLVDDHTLFRETLRLALAREPDLEIVGEAENGLTGQEVAAEQKPDVILMDIAMPVVGGINATRQLQQHHPEIAVIILSAHTDEGNVFHALKLGARGYLPKTVTVGEVARTIRVVAAGNSLLDASITNDVLAEFRRLSPQESDHLGALSAIECAILAHVAAGDSNKEVGLAVHLAENTVKNRLGVVFEKIGVLDRTQAAIYALRHGIAPAPATPRPWLDKAA